LLLAAAGCGGEKTVEPLPETVQGTIQQETLPKGDAAAGKTVFTDTGCGSCHTFKAANASGTVGPNLDDVLAGKPADFIHESIVNPNGEIAQGYQPNIMPQNYGQQLSDQQLADLIAFLQH
jgi:mono/diheme cytochrome c family protein